MPHDGPDQRGTSSLQTAEDATVDGIGDAIADTCIRCHTARLCAALSSAVTYFASPAKVFRGSGSVLFCHPRFFDRPRHASVNPTCEAKQRPRSEVSNLNIAIIKVRVAPDDSDIF